jgi:hypothetical protein
MYLFELKEYSQIYDIQKSVDLLGYNFNNIVSNWAYILGIHYNKYFRFWYNI